MDIETGKLYTPEEVAAMTAEMRAKLTWITRKEYQEMSLYDEAERPQRLRESRAKADAKKKQARKAQRTSRKKNR